MTGKVEGIVIFDDKIY